MQYVSNVARWAAAEGELCAGSVAAGKKTEPASTMLIEVRTRVRTMCGSLPRANKSPDWAGYTNVCLLTSVPFCSFGRKWRLRLSRRSLFHVRADDVDEILSPCWSSDLAPGAPKRVVGGY